MSTTIVEETRSVAGGQRSGWRTATALGISLVVVLVLAWGLRWITHPDVLYPLGNGEGLRAKAGETFAFDTSIVADRNQYNTPAQPVTVTIHEVVPVITRNTADAEVSIVLCEGKSAGGVGTVAAADVPLYCTTTTPLAALSDFAFNYAGGQQLVALITPRRPGVVVINGFKVTYADGIRRGSQLAGITIKVRAKATPQAPETIDPNN